jgi:hypothetical protein
MGKCYFQNSRSVPPAWTLDAKPDARHPHFLALLVLTGSMALENL